MLGSLRRILADEDYAEVNLENPYCELLNEIFQEFAAIHMYYFDRTAILDDVCGAVLVPRCTAK
jgi:hypothetical protein